MARGGSVLRQLSKAALLKSECGIPSIVGATQQSRYVHQILSVRLGLEVPDPLSTFRNG